MRAKSYLLALLALFSAGLAQPADPREDRKRVDAELALAGALLESASAQAQAAVGRLAELNLALPPARHAAALARGTVAAAESQVAASRREADTARGVWREAQQRYEVAAGRVSEGRVRLGRFVSVSYRGGDVAQFNALVGSSGPGELIRRAGYARQVAQAKKGAVDELLGALWDAQHVSNQAAMAKRTADGALASAQAAMVEAAAAREAAERTERELSDLVAQQEMAVAAAELHRADMTRQHEELKRESERIAAELRAWEAQAQPGPVLRPGARLLMPVSGWKSSNYGQRYDPYYHVWQLHAGVDIAAGGGESIYAAADGQVASAGWRGGYGNYTCLGHGSYDGRNLSTCYAHQSRILVSVGQRVSRGQLIGRVGTTGASTGNHLHFEVRLNGTPTDPEDWLPQCLC